MALAFLGACASETVVHGVGEKEANLIVEVLADNDVTANKTMNASGREVVYDLAVSSSRRLDAIRVLNQHDLPRRRDRGYADIFAESGLIPTSSEEKAKRLAALEGEIERQLKLIDGVLDVQVQLVLPDESALRTTKEQEPTTTASVTARYLPLADGGKPVTESAVQAIVAAGVEKLLPENVVVVLRAAGQSPTAKSVQREVGGFLGKLTPKTLYVVLVGLLAVAAIGWVVAIFSQWQVRSVRGRLIRLQTEIAKARRKSTEALPAAAAGGSS